MEETVLQLEKSEDMKSFLKKHNIAKFLRKNMNIDYPSVLQYNAIPIIQKENNVILQYTPPAGVKLTSLLPLLSSVYRNQKAASEESGKIITNKSIMIIYCASKARCNELMATLNPLLMTKVEGESKMKVLMLDHAIEHASDLNSLYEQKDEGIKKKKKTLDFDILITNNLQYLLQNECFTGLKQKVHISGLLLDKVDLHFATDQDAELISCGEMIQPLLAEDSKIILTTNEQEEQHESFNEVKTAFFAEKKSVIVKLKEQTRSATRYLSIGHLLIECGSELDKFLAFYTMVKFNVLSGRTLVFVDNLFEAYKVKIFMEKFAIRTAVVNPEATKVMRKSALRYFHAGQYDILILVRMKYSYKIKTSQVVNVVNFTTPQNLQDYNMAAHKLGFDNASVLTFTYKEDAKIAENMEAKYLTNLEKKMTKKYGKSLFVKLPIDWVEIYRLKSRVDDILCTLTNKKIKNYMGNEIKKQILNNKKLKDYFNEHQEEKDILRASLETDYKYRFMNKNLDFVPEYCMPKHILVKEVEKQLKGNPLDHQESAELVQGLTNDLILVQKLATVQATKRYIPTLKYEDPKTVDPERLEYTAGRKLWKIQHKKRVKKGVKKAKDGYMGS